MASKNGHYSVPETSGTSFVCKCGVVLGMTYEKVYHDKTALVIGQTIIGSSVVLNCVKCGNQTKFHVNRDRD